MESINNLYDDRIYPNDLTSILLLIIYLPFGICLLIIRLIIIIILLLTNNIKNSSILCKTLGLFVVTNSCSIKKEDEKIIIIFVHF